jgi:renalase
MKDFCIVGSGIAGSTIANLLKKNYSIEIFEKARGPGGRSSNRRYKTKLSFDHGLQYISPKNINFKNFIHKLVNLNILTPWKGPHLDLSFDKKKFSEKYIGRKSNSIICKHLIGNIKINYLSEVTVIKFNTNHWEITLNNKNKIFFKNLILTCPFPQLKILASKYIKEEILNYKTDTVPNITVMAAFKGYKKIPLSSVKFDNSIIKWASFENSKNRFKTNLSLWTIQSNEKWSKKYINKYKNNRFKTSQILLNEFEKLMGFKIKNLVFSNIHGWKYAFNKIKNNFNSLWLKKCNLGVCADWALGSKAEDAWLSANSLYGKVKKNPPNKS